MKFPKYLFAALTMISSMLVTTQLSAHCQIPCGIYDDHARVKSMFEDAATVTKAMDQMMTLNAKTDLQSKNQMVRWINNKESHAQKIIDTIGDYFLTQRVKPSQKDYAERLAKHHAVILAAMKAKQGSKATDAELLVKAIEAVKPYYPEHKH